MKPVYLMAGGNWRDRNAPDPGFVAGLQGVGHSSPSVAYIGAANGDDGSFFKWFQTLASQAGAGQIALAPLVGKHANRDLAMDVLAKADAVFVSGGDVEAGMRTLESSQMCDHLRELHRQGKQFLGMSAGSIMLGATWVRWPDENNETRVETFPCLGIAPLICDTHGEKDAWEELHALLRISDVGTIGYGIPTGCTLVAESNGSVRSLAGPVHRFQRTPRSVRRMRDV
jgi:cyanophycinase-like exopeptidase